MFRNSSEVSVFTFYFSLQCARNLNRANHNRLFSIEILITGVTWTKVLINRKTMVSGWNSGNVPVMHSFAPKILPQTSSPFLWLLWQKYLMHLTSNAEHEIWSVFSYFCAQYLNGVLFEKKNQGDLLLDRDLTLSVRRRVPASTRVPNLQKYQLNICTKSLKISH